jgi:hypothetical protein
MNTEARLKRTSAAVALAASITILFSTALAWAKDTYQPLNTAMNALTGHNWITHGVTDVILFVGLGLMFSGTRWAERIAPNHMVGGLVAAVVVAGVGLFIWYAAF